MKTRPLRTQPPTTPPSNAVDPADLRTVALVGHRCSGKTTLAELLLQEARVVREMGSVDEGTTLLDWSAVSRRHRQTVELATAWLEWGPTIVQLLDTPGTASLCEVRDLGLSAAEAAVITIDATAGIEVGTEEAIRAAVRRGMAAIVVVTKVERRPDAAWLTDLAASWSALSVSIPREDPVGLDSAASTPGGDRPGLGSSHDSTGSTFSGDRGVDLRLGAASGPSSRAVLMHLPFCEPTPQGKLVGLVDVLDGRVLRYASDGTGLWSPEPVPDALRAAVSAAREAIVEAVALTDDALLERYLEDLTLPTEIVRPALARAIHARQLVPVLLVSALHRIGAGVVLDALSAWVPPYAIGARCAVDRRLREHDGSATPLDPAGSFVVQVLSEHRDEERAEPWHLLRVLAGAAPRGDWIDGRSGTSHRVRRLYRMRGSRRASAPPLVPGLIVGTYDPLPVSSGTTLTDGARWEVELPRPRPPMMALWVRAIQPRDEARLNEALQALIRADRGLALLSDTASGTMLLSGSDESHLRIAIERLLQWADGIQVVTELPPVGYVETPAARVLGVEGLHVRADGEGLVEEFGRCELALVPTPPEQGTTFVDALDDDEELPVRYRGAIDEGAQAAMRHGPTAGYPVVGAKLELTGGAYDILQSTDDHFRLAGEKAARNALERVGTRLLEPWWKLEIKAPQTAVGDLISDISAHRGRILGMEVEGDTAALTALSPYRELRTFASRLQALTGGRGRFETVMSHYEALPDHLLREAIEASPHRRVAGRF
ncbi:MAG: GTP-binding protein [Myxococcota bacterium]